LRWDESRNLFQIKDLKKILVLNHRLRQHKNFFNLLILTADTVASQAEWVKMHEEVLYLVNSQLKMRVCRLQNKNCQRFELLQLKRQVQNHAVGPNQLQVQTESKGQQQLWQPYQRDQPLKKKKQHLVLKDHRLRKS